MTILRRQRFFHSAFAVALSILAIVNPVSARDTGEIPEFPPPPRPTSTTPAPLLGLASQNRCANSIPYQIDRMQQGSNGSFSHLLGFRTGGFIPGWRYTQTRENTGPIIDSFLGRVWWDGGNNHFQSLARYANTAYGKFFVWSGADWHNGPEGGAHLFFATMDSRSEELNDSMTGGAGGRPASNFQPDAQFGWSMPAPQDRIFHRMDLDNSTMHPDGSTTYWHAGGIQAYNGLLAVALENGSFNIGGGEGHNKGKITFVNVDIPWFPARMSPTSEIFSTEGKIGAVALTQNRDGHWIVAAWRDRKIWLYISKLKGGPQAAEGGWTPLGSWAEAGGYEHTRLPAPGSIDDKAGYYQSINFINGCDGTFYIAGMNNSNLGGTGMFGEDWFDLYAIERTNDGVPNRFKFRKIWKKQFTLPSDHASFKMASGVYVSPAGKIMMYAGGGYLETRMNGAKWLNYREFIAP